MRLLVFLLFIVGYSCDIRVSISQSGDYYVTINNQLWLRSARTAVYVDDRWYSTDNQSLPLVEMRTVQGTDPDLGSWNETQLVYSLVRQQGPSTIVARIRQWNLVPAYTFYLETGDKTLMNKIALDMEQVRTVFPSFHIEQLGTNDDRGYFTFGGKVCIS